MVVSTRSKTRHPKPADRAPSRRRPPQDSLAVRVPPFCPERRHVLDALSEAPIVQAYLKALSHAHPNLRVASKEVCSRDAKQNAWELNDPENFAVATTVAKMAKATGFMCLVASPDTAVFERSAAIRRMPSNLSETDRERYLAEARAGHFGGEADWHCTAAVLYDHVLRIYNPSFELPIKQPPYRWGDFTGIRQAQYLWKELKKNGFRIDLVKTGGGGNITGECRRMCQEWMNQMAPLLDILAGGGSDCVQKRSTPSSSLQLRWM